MCDKWRIHVFHWYAAAVLCVCETSYHIFCKSFVVHVFHVCLFLPLLRKMMMMVHVVPVHYHHHHCHHHLHHYHHRLCLVAHFYMFENELREIGMREMFSDKVDIVQRGVLSVGIPCGDWVWSLLEMVFHSRDICSVLFLHHVLFDCGRSVLSSWQNVFCKGHTMVIDQGKNKQRDKEKWDALESG